LEIAEKQLGPDHPHVATSLNNLAALLEAQGKYAEAEPLYRRAIAICEKTLGPEHPNTKTARENLEILLSERSRK
jgi:tetratricopeptide (TPR) repeat protein